MATRKEPLGSLPSGCDLSNTNAAVTWYLWPLRTAAHSQRLNSSPGLVEVLSPSLAAASSYRSRHILAVLSLEPVARKEVSPPDPCFVSFGPPP